MAIKEAKLKQESAPETITAQCPFCFKDVRVRSIPPHTCPECHRTGTFMEKGVPTAPFDLQL